MTTPGQDKWHEDIYIYYRCVYAVRRDWRNGERDARSDPQPDVFKLKQGKVLSDQAELFVASVTLFHNEPQLRCFV